MTVDPYDTAALAAAMKDVALNADLRRRLAEKGRERLKRFSWHESARQLLAELEAAAG